MSERGVYAIDRGVWDHPSFPPEPYSEREAWMWLCGQAAWAATRVRIGRKYIPVERGQCAFAMRFLAIKWQWSEPRVRRFFKRRSSDAMVMVQSTRDATLITICNYEKYAFGRRAADAPSDAQSDGESTAERRKEEELKNINISEAKASESAAPHAPAEKPKRTRKASPKVPLPDDWAPNEAALAEFGIEACAREGPKIRDWAKAKAATMADWNAFFRNWMRKDVNGGFGGQSQQARNGTGGPSQGTTFAERAVAGYRRAAAAFESSS